MVLGFIKDVIEIIVGCFVLLFRLMQSRRNTPDLQSIVVANKVAVNPTTPVVTFSVSQEVIAVEPVPRTPAKERSWNGAAHDYSRK